MAEIIELNQDGAKEEKRHRARHRVKIRKRVKIKKKESPKKLIAKIFKVSMWVLVLGAFIFTMVMLYRTSEVDYKGGKSAPPGKIK